MTHPLKCGLASGLALLLCSAVGQAAISAFTAGGDGAQNFGGSLGMTFVVTGASPIEVTSLGAFDNLGNGFAAGTTITVSLWEATATTTAGGGSSPYSFGTQTGTDLFASAGTLLGTLTFTTADGTSGGASGFVYKALGSPITLTNDRAYVISASGYNANDLLRNNTTGITAVNSPILITANGFSGTPNVLPGTGDGYHSQNITAGGVTGGKYAAGSFEFNAVPEPSVALLGGMGVLALLRRRRA